MAKTEQLTAGKYEIVRPNSRYRQTTSAPGKPHEWVEYVTGDIVELTADEATRIRDIIGKPGAAAQAEADRLKAEAAAAATRADEARARAAAASKGASTTAKTPGAKTPSSDAPAGNASLEEWQKFALTQDGVTEDAIKDMSRDDLREMFGPKPS